MQRHLSMFRRGLLIWSLTLVAPPVSAALAQGEPPSPWTDERANALVRIEAPGKHPAPDVATGFIVNGHGGKQYVATSTHGLLPALTEEEVKALDPVDCGPLPDQTKLSQGNTGGPQLPANCAYHIGHDVSLVELSPGTSPLPALSFRACGLEENDDIFLGGFPLGNRLTVPGKVRGNGPQEMIITDSTTAPGLNGAPYLTADGDVVAIQSGLSSTLPQHLAYVLPVAAVRTQLEALLPEMKTEEHCPKRMSYDQAFQERMDNLLEGLVASVGSVPFDDKPDARLKMWIQNVEQFIDGIHKYVQWGMNLDEKRPVGPVVTIWYRRLVATKELPPANDMVLVVTPMTNSPLSLQEPGKLVYSSNHIEQTQGQSGKYEVFIDSTLKSMASEMQESINHISIDLRYRNDTSIQDTRTFTLSDPVEP